MPDGSAEMNRPTEAKSKDPYSTPQLTIYGTVEQLTKTIGSKDSPDGGAFPKDRTHI